MDGTIRFGLSHWFRIHLSGALIAGICGFPEGRNGDVTRSMVMGHLFITRVTSQWKVTMVMNFCTVHTVFE